MARAPTWMRTSAAGCRSRPRAAGCDSTSTTGDPSTGYNGENTYLIGPRIAPYTFRKFTPYGKVLVGFGNGSFLTGRRFAVTYGGGVDYRLTRRFTLRAFDFEYQQWQVTPTLHPYGGSVGLSYKIF